MSMISNAFILLLPFFFSAQHPISTGDNKIPRLALAPVEYIFFDRKASKNPDEYEAMEEQRAAEYQKAIYDQLQKISAKHHFELMQPFEKPQHSDSSYVAMSEDDYYKSSDGLIFVKVIYRKIQSEFSAYNNNTSIKTGEIKFDVRVVDTGSGNEIWHTFHEHELYSQIRTLSAQNPIHFCTRVIKKEFPKFK